MSTRYILAIAGISMLFLLTMREEFSIMSSRLFSLRGRSENEVWTLPEEILEFDENGDETEEWLAKQQEEPSKTIIDELMPSSPSFSDAPATTLPIITDILPSKNSNRTLANLWGTSTNATLERREKINYGVHIIMSFYKGTYKKDRFQEILMSLKRNLKNPYVTAVHTLWEDRDPIIYVNNSVLEKKLIRVQFGVQPTYKDFFDYANLRLGRGAIGIVTNSDIYFDETVECVTPVTPEKKAFNATKQHLVYALSRHPSNPCVGRADYCEGYTGSHDSFVFALPLPYRFSSRVDFTQNHIGAENVIIWEFRRLEGYVVRNPCHTIKCYHVHCTNERHYKMGTISRGKNRIGPIDRHGSIVPSKLKCGQMIY
jgi:hypothetical protein